MPLVVVASLLPGASLEATARNLGYGIREMGLYKRAHTKARKPPGHFRVLKPVLPSNSFFFYFKSPDKNKWKTTARAAKHDKYAIKKAK